MIKNIQIKIVILFILVGVILVGSLGGLYIHNLQELNNEVLSNNAGNIQEISNLIINQISNTKVMVIIFIILFIIFLTSSEAFLKFSNNTIDIGNIFMFSKTVFFSS